jgi:hypothetical protein
MLVSFMLSVVYADCHKLAFMLSVIMLNVIMLCVDMLCVVMLNVIMLRVVAPQFKSYMQILD